MSQIGYLDRKTHLRLVIVIQNLHHLISHRGHLDSAEADLHICKILYLFFDQSTLRVTFGIVIMTHIVILVTVSRGISQEYRQFAL
jgi:hypothetical protein